MWSAAVLTYGSFQTVVSFKNSDEHWYPLGTKEVEMEGISPRIE